MKNSLKSLRTPLVCLGVALIYALPLLTLRGGVDMFLKIDGVDGEATDSAHKDEIDVLSWSWGMTNDGTTHTGGGGGGGKVTVKDVTLTKYIDKATPDIMLQTLTGSTFTNATLYVQKLDASSAPTPYDYIKIYMEKVLVTSVVSGGENSEDRLTENVTLNFEKVTWTYTELDPSSGGPGTEHAFSWDIPNEQEP